jgi:catechol 2,3-dioxygenase-like lactoylglutathione lyase family enzyme
MSGRAEITGAVHHVNFSVSDLARSVDWYSKVFGLSVLLEAPDADGRCDKVILRHPSGLLVGLSAHRANPGAPASESRCGLDHLAFNVPDAGALPAWMEHLDDLGVAHSDVKETPLGKLVVLRDPDNIQLEVYAPKQT